jgi:hypothetical protein
MLDPLKYTEVEVGIFFLSGERLKIRLLTFGLHVCSGGSRNFVWGGQSSLPFPFLPFPFSLPFPFLPFFLPFPFSLPFPFLPFLLPSPFSLPFPFLPFLLPSPFSLPFCLPSCPSPSLLAGVRGYNPRKKFLNYRCSYVNFGAFLTKIQLLRTPTFVPTNCVRKSTYRY